ncbi:MAG: hypothetical protein AAGF12_17975 [Myxococcota bacterium]
MAEGSRSEQPCRTDPQAHDARPNFLERLALRYLSQREAALPPVEADDELHILNDREQRDLLRVERMMVLRAALVGALSALVSGIAELLAQPTLGADPDAATWGQQAVFWSIVGGATAVATAFEVAFLYWDALRSVHTMARAAGIDLFPAEEETTAVARSLTRAALEMPSPTRGPHQINAHAEISKWQVLVATLLYKLKIGITSFLLKALLRRLLGRAALRVWLVFVSVPVTAAWNAVVAFWVIREARIRAIGPSRAIEFCDRLLPDTELAPDAREGVLRAVAASIVRTRAVHPNLLAFLREVEARVGTPDLDDLDNTQRYLQLLPTLDPEAQALSLKILAASAVIDGRLSRAERALLREARRATGRSSHLGAIVTLGRVVSRGRLLEDPHLEAVAAD